MREMESKEEAVVRGRAEPEGAVFGSVFGNVGIGIAFGIVFGAAFGAVYSAYSKRSD